MQSHRVKAPTLGRCLALHKSDVPRFYSTSTAGSPAARTAAGADSVSADGAGDDGLQVPCFYCMFPHRLYSKISPKQQPVLQLSAFPSGYTTSTFYADLGKPGLASQPSPAQPLPPALQGPALPLTHLSEDQPRSFS